MNRQTALGYLAARFAETSSASLSSSLSASSGRKIQVVEDSLRIQYSQPSHQSDRTAYHDRIEYYEDIVRSGGLSQLDRGPVSSSDRLQDYVRKSSRGYDECDADRAGDDRRMSSSRNEDRYASASIDRLSSDGRGDRTSYGSSRDARKPESPHYESSRARSRDRGQREFSSSSYRARSPLDNRGRREGSRGEVVQSRYEDHSQTREDLEMRASKGQNVASGSSRGRENVVKAATSGSMMGAAMYRGVPPPPSGGSDREGPSYCDICNLSFPDNKRYDIHCGGFVHARQVMNKSTAKPVPPPVTSVSQVSSKGQVTVPPNRGQVATSIAAPTALPAAITSTAPAVPKVASNAAKLDDELKNGVFCDLCDQFFSLKNNVWNKHLASTDHRKKYLTSILDLGPDEFKELYGDVSFGETKDEMSDLPEVKDSYQKVLLQSGIYDKFKCRVCDLNMNDYLNWIGHLDGRKHKNLVTKKIGEMGPKDYTKLFGDIPAHFHKRSFGITDEDLLYDPFKEESASVDDKKTSYGGNTKGMGTVQKKPEQSRSDDRDNKRIDSSYSGNVGKQTEQQKTSEKSQPKSRDYQSSVERQAEKRNESGSSGSQRLERIDNKQDRESVNSRAQATNNQRQGSGIASSADRQFGYKAHQQTSDGNRKGVVALLDMKVEKKDQQPRGRLPQQPRLQPESSGVANSSKGFLGSSLPPSMHQQLAMDAKASLDRHLRQTAAIQNMPAPVFGQFRVGEYEQVLSTLPTDQRQVFVTLNPDEGVQFLKLSPEERRIFTLKNAEQSRLFATLKPEERHVYLMLRDDLRKFFVSLLPGERQLFLLLNQQERMFYASLPPEQRHLLSILPPEQRSFFVMLNAEARRVFSGLSADERLLFMLMNAEERQLFGLLTPEMRQVFTMLNPEGRLFFGALNAQQRHLFAMLNPEERLFFSSLTPEERQLFVASPPDQRQLYATLNAEQRQIFASLNPEHRQVLVSFASPEHRLVFVSLDQDQRQLLASFDPNMRLTIVQMMLQTGINKVSVVLDVVQMLSALDPAILQALNNLSPEVIRRIVEGDQDVIGAIFRRASGAHMDPAVESLRVEANMAAARDFLSSPQLLQAISSGQLSTQILESLLGVVGRFSGDVLPEMMNSANVVGNFPGNFGNGPGNFGNLPREFPNAGRGGNRGGASGRGNPGQRRGLGKRY